MGMFDYVTCEYPLPELPDWAEPQFQTKSFDISRLDSYVITADGELTKDGEPVRLTGEIRFYCLHSQYGQEERFRGYWLEYVALFHKGAASRRRASDSARA